MEEVPATRRGRPHGYIADGFVVVEDSEVGEIVVFYSVALIFWCNILIRCCICCAGGGLFK